MVEKLGRGCRDGFFFKTPKMVLQKLLVGDFVGVTG